MGKFEEGGAGVYQYVWGCIHTDDVVIGLRGDRHGWVVEADDEGALGRVRLSGLAQRFRPFSVFYTAVVYSDIRTCRKATLLLQKNFEVITNFRQKRLVCNRTPWMYFIKHHIYRSLRFKRNNSCVSIFVKCFLEERKNLLTIVVVFQLKTA